MRFHIFISINCFIIIADFSFHVPAYVIQVVNNFHKDIQEATKHYFCYGFDFVIKLITYLRYL